MGKVNPRYLVLQHPALFAGLCGGVVGVLLDVDHILTFYFPQLGARPLHQPALYLSCGFTVYYIACAGRSFLETVLKKGTK